MNQSSPKHMTRRQSDPVRPSTRRRIIDCHQHLFSLGSAEDMAAEYARLGVEQAVLLGLPPPRYPDNNPVVLEAHRRYPSLFVPFVGFELDGMNANDLARFRDRGFRGVKFIGPRRPYNDPAYFPIYEQAARLKMPALFHLGIVANTPEWKDCDSDLMRPVYLDHIARRIPELTLIGAHAGNPWTDEAAMACRWNPNLFLDLSGSILKYRSPEFLAQLLWWKSEGPYRSPDGADAWQKIVFGSDVETRQIADVIQDYGRLMKSIGLARSLQQAVWHGTAARILAGG